MSKIFKPRRIKYSTATGTKGAGIVPASGEMIVVSPTAGHGKGAGKIVIGDGSTTVQAYATNGKALVDDMKFSGSETLSSVGSDSSTTVATALSNVASGKTLSSLFGSLKQAVSLLNTSVTSLNDENSRDAESRYFYYTNHDQLDVTGCGLNGAQFNTKFSYFILGNKTFVNTSSDNSEQDVYIIYLAIFANKYKCGTDNSNYYQFSYTPIINKLNQVITNRTFTFFTNIRPYFKLEVEDEDYYKNNYSSVYNIVEENLTSVMFSRFYKNDSDSISTGAIPEPDCKTGLYVWSTELAFSFVAK